MDSKRRRIGDESVQRRRLDPAIVSAARLCVSPYLVAATPRWVRPGLVTRCVNDGDIVNASCWWTRMMSAYHNLFEWIFAAVLTACLVSPWVFRFRGRISTVVAAATVGLHLAPCLWLTLFDPNWNGCTVCTCNLGVRQMRIYLPVTCTMAFQGRRIALPTALEGHRTVNSLLPNALHARDGRILRISPRGILLAPGVVDFDRGDCSRRLHSS